LEGFVETQVDAGLSARITGDPVLTLSSTRAMINGQLQSILLLIAIVILIIAVLFTDIKVGLLAALPNVFPLLVLFGFMGYAGVPLNIGTAMAAAIAIGLAVDDTMHFLLRYNLELKTSRSQLKAMEATIQGEVLPVIATTIALTSGFLVFSFSDFEPVAQFGLLSALVMVAALVADFVLTPILMSVLRLVTLWDLLSSRLRQQIIPRSPLFKGMRPWQIRRYVLSSSVLEFDAGEAVFTQGDGSHELYLVMSGMVEVSVAIKGGAERRVIDQFESGDLFGDIAMLAGVPRHADAVAQVRTRLLVLSDDALRKAAALNPFLGSRLCINLATDISKRWVRLVQRAQQNPGASENNDAVNKPDQSSERDER
jgi:hypothetical protein